MKAKYPIYIVSKGRWDSRLTSKALESMNVPYHIIVEPQEYEEYANVIDKEKVLMLPQKYHDEYDPCTDEKHKSNGPGAARNFAWQHSIDNGYTSHWVMDDNITGFGRVNRNKYHRVKSGAIFRACEDFVDRYENVAISGLQYYMFFPLKEKRPAFIQNTRIYSCLLIRNHLKYRWRGRYNEDTDLSLRVLKDGLCTVEFMAFLQEKLMTQTLKGGNTEEFYAGEGTMKKSAMLQKMHPEVARVIWRYGRWHHFVDYNSFKKNKLVLKKDIKLTDEKNEFGMVVKKVK
tara:strand:+ start:16082 stop:16945 length:864 start_codon:yes stop_codon:yes gene_type:complete